MRRLLLPLGIALVALLTLACGGGGPTASPSPTAEAQVPTSEPTVTAALTPTPEPALETLAFIDGGDLWLVNADISDRRRITQFGGSDREVVSFEWLLSGQEIAYWVSLPSDPGSPRFTSVLANVEGRVLWERELRPTAFRFGLPTGVFWSPDGQLVAVFDETDVSIEDRDGQSVWTGNGGEGSGSWSADGSHFAIVEGDEVVVISRDGTSVSRLHAGPTLDVPADLPKGTCGPIEEVRRIIPDYELLLGRPVFGPDGRNVLVAVSCSINTGTGGIFGTVIYEASLDGLINRPVPDSAVTSLPTPVFSPDGRRVALLGAARGVPCPYGASAVVTMDLTLLNPDEGTTSELTPGEIVQLANDLAAGERFPPDIQISGRFQANPVVWSPASDAIVTSFSAAECVLDPDRPSEVEGEHRLLAEGVYLLRLDGVAEEKIADEFSDTVRWSPSGDLIAYVSGEPTDAPQIRVFNLLTREVTDLGPGHSPAWQPLPSEALSLPWEGEVTDDLRIRSEANTASDIVGTLAKGTKVRVYGEAEGEEAEASSGNRTWYRVIGGWVYSASVGR